MEYMKYFLVFLEMVEQILETTQLDKELTSLNQQADNLKFGLDLIGLEHGVTLGLSIEFVLLNNQLMTSHFLTE